VFSRNALYKSTFYLLTYLLYTTYVQQSYYHTVQCNELSITRSRCTETKLTDTWFSKLTDTWFSWHGPWQYSINDARVWSTRNAFDSLM